MQLRQAAEAAQQRRTQIAEDTADVAAQHELVRSSAT